MTTKLRLVDLSDENIANSVHFIEGHEDDMDEGDKLCWARVKEMILGLADDLVEPQTSPAEALCARTQDAYSYDNFAPGEWLKAIEFLLSVGWTEAEVEAIMRSKWTRWCRDEAGVHNDATAEHLKAFMLNPRNRCTREEVKSML